MASVSKLSHNFPRYKKCYDVFDRITGKLKLYKQWANDVFPSIVEDIFPERTVNSRFCSLGIGSGSGEFEVALLKQLMHHFPSIHHTVVEPSENYVSHYKRYFTLNDVDYDWQLKKIQEYREDYGDTPNGRKFDFISAVNSLYYVDDLPETLRFLLNLLTPKGCLMIGIRSELGTGYRLLSNFPELGSAFEGNYLLTSNKIVDVLSDMGLKTTSYHIPTTFDLSSVFNQGDEDGDALLEVYTEVLDFRRTASKALQEGVMEFLRAEKSPADLDQREVGCQQGFMEWDMLFVGNNK